MLAGCRSNNEGQPLDGAATRALVSELFIMSAGKPNEGNIDMAHKLAIACLSQQVLVQQAGKVSQ